MESDERPDFLVVEDDDDDFFLVSDLLRTELAYAAEQVRSVDEALERIAAREFALILLDYSLGARNGLDLLAELRARDNITPVIFLTGHGDEQVAVRALKGGAVDYLAKSNMTRESLAAAVRHALALRDRDAAVREAREALSAREREYRTLFEKANDAIFIIDPETEIVLEANPAAARLYGVEHDQLIGRSLIDFSTDIVRGRHAIDECVAAGELANFETIHISRDGRRLHLLLNSSLIEYRGRSALLNLCRDISERKAAEQEIFRLNRALKALSKCNEALLRARQPQQFLEEICDIMVQVGGYRMAWVAARPAGREDRVEPLAISGTDRDYVEAVCNRYGNLETSPLLVPTALRTGAPAVCRDTSTSPLEARNDCLEHGFASIIALPLTREGRVLGALAIYAGERDAFDNAEVDLLRELAGDVSYGLDSIEAREQRERAEVELKSSETRLRNLIETANEGIWTIDAEERTTFVNAKMAAMLGRIPEEMLGTHIKEFIYAGQHELIDVSMMERRAMARGHYEVMLVNKDGGHIITSLNSSPILDGNGHYAGALGMLTDITEQKQAEKKLRESEQRYRTLFERNLAGVFRATANGTLLEANDAFRRMLGYDTNDDFPALTLPQMCAAAGCAERWHEKLIATGQLVNLEISILRKDGGTAYLLANLVTVGREAGGVSREVAPQLSSLKTQASSPAPPFIEGTVLDVTAHRQLQAQLLHSQKMDAIGQLAGGIAHDFNNLLMVIRSYAEMAAESREAGGLRAQGAGRMAQGPGLVPQDSSDETLKRQLDAIMKAADRGAALTRQLLTFGRKQTFSPRVMELNSVLENMTRVLPRALGEDVRVELRAAPGLWQVKADPVQIEQLVLNLAVNARDAMPSGGRLTIETDNTVLDSDYVKLHAGVTPGEYVMLAVSDTGHGIAPDVLPRIFEPFFTTKERGKGTGLGLPTVYGIVQQCGGFVWVYSEVGQGTVFKIYLPRNGAGAASTSTPAPAKPVRISGSETILIVEDEEAVRCATRDYLARCGYRVFEAASGEEALRSSDQHRGTINLLITDGVMPGMSGMALAQEISERRPGIRILCVSGYTEASMSAHGLSADTAFLQKPFSLAALAAKVRELLDAQPHQHAA